MLLKSSTTQSSIRFDVIDVIGVLLVTMLLGQPLHAENQNQSLIASDSFEYPHGLSRSSNQGVGWAGPWVISPNAPPSLVSINSPETRHDVVISGTNERNNPIRRQLAEKFQRDQLFVGFRLTYLSNEQEPSREPEFFVLWMDRLDGSDTSLHNNAVPNIGVHVAERGPQKDKTVFMIRTSPNRTAWTNIELQKDQTYYLVAELKKSKNGLREDYSQIKLWVNPEPDQYHKPDAQLDGQQNINQVGWLGFATGKKTEIHDQIRIGNLNLSTNWKEILNQRDAPTVLQNQANSPHELAWKEKVHFRKDVYPILKEHCFDCHSGEYPDSGYRLDIRDEWLGFSTGEPFVVPGRSQQSQLIHVLTTNSDLRMPPDSKPLSPESIAKLRAWIDQGFAWDDELLPTPPVESDHWAFQKIRRPDPPAIQQMAWARNPIDQFIAARHEQVGIAPAEIATRRILIRRLYLDLLGFPPSPDQVLHFLADQSPSAYRDLVERILASPHYGERWGRYWLDLARWAESQGYQHDIPRPFAWRYRDYVINSFNEDKPYNQFLREQIAGDELYPYSDHHVIATGFLAAARISGNQMDKKLQRNDVLVDIVNNTSSAILGLTLECAQCHNHKFEPLTQRDYYRFQAFFANGQLGNLSLIHTSEPEVSEIESWIPTEAYKFYLREAKKLKIDSKAYEPHTWGYYSPLTGLESIKRYAVVNRSPIPYLPQVLKQVQSRILVRGDVNSPGLPVAPGWPAVLGNTPSKFSKTPRQSLVSWMESPENPLVARVWVNRLWQYHFGRGIVASSSDFGIHGAPPSHPELLDWLASELMDHQWSSKHIHRLIVNSNTYRQSSKHPRRYDNDPENQLFWKWTPRRLEAEAIRDSILAATGEMDPTIGGPSIPPRREEEELRRTIYLAQRRSELPDIMTMFDAPDGIRSCSRREVSTVALQPLYLLNSQFVLKRAQQMADSITAIARGNRTRQIELLFLKTLGRLPEPEELERSLDEFRMAVVQQSNSIDIDHRNHLIRIAHAMLNLNEFLYIP